MEIGITKYYLEYYNSIYALILLSVYKILLCCWTKECMKPKKDILQIQIQINWPFRKRSLSNIKRYLFYADAISS